MLIRRAARPRRRPRYLEALEVLEPRTLLSVMIGPTGRTATYTDVDGDLVTIAVSKGAFTSDDFQTLPDAMGDALLGIDLSAGGFDGANLSITAKKSGGGDGLVAVGFIDSAGHNLGRVSIAGDLEGISVGDGSGTALQSLSVQSMGLSSSGPYDTFNSEINGALGTLSVKGDIANTSINVTGSAHASIARIDIGGSLIGGAADFSGSIRCQGNLGPITIGGSVEGGGGIQSAQIAAGGMLSELAVGGSVIGGAGGKSAQIYAVQKIGPMSVRGDLAGGGGSQSAQISCQSGSITSIFVGGSVIGSAGENSAQIFAQQNMGPITVSGDVQGGDGQFSAEIGPTQGKLAKLTIAGSILGGNGNGSGVIYGGTALGILSVGGSITGGAGQWSAEVYSKGPMGPISIGGSVTGGEGDDSGEINTDNGTTAGTYTISRIYIGGSLLGGSGNYSGRISADGNIGPVGVKGDVIGGDGSFSGAVTSSSGSIGEIFVGGSVRGAIGNNSASIVGDSTIGAIRIAGSVVGGDGDDAASIISDGDAGSIYIGGSVIGGAGLDSASFRISGNGSTVQIEGDIRGGAGNSSGNVWFGGSVRRAAVGGSVYGGPGAASGGVSAEGRGGRGGPDRSSSVLSIAGTVNGTTALRSPEVGGNFNSIVIGGNVVDATVYGVSLREVFIGGSVISTGEVQGGALITATTMGKVEIRGSALGYDDGTTDIPVVIAAEGISRVQAYGGGFGQSQSGPVIGSITIEGSLDLADILAGYSFLDDPENPHAQIGTVNIGGDCIASNIIAGAQNPASADVSFGDSNDSLISDVNGTADANTSLSSIAKITINGTVNGSDSATNADDHFGFVAQQIGALTVHGTKITLASGPSNDDIPLGDTGDFNLHEIGT